MPRLSLLTLTFVCFAVAGCRPALPPGKPIDQLTAEEVSGHTVFQQQCARCHTAYSTQGLHGPSLYGVFRKPFLPSGSPANNDRVIATILHGHGLMPAFNNTFNNNAADPQLQVLLRYLHTL